MCIVCSLGVLLPRCDYSSTAALSHSLGLSFAGDETESRIAQLVFGDPRSLVAVASAAKAAVCC